MKAGRPVSPSQAAANSNAAVAVLGNPDAAAETPDVVSGPGNQVGALLDVLQL